MARARDRKKLNWNASCCGLKIYLQPPTIRTRPKKEILVRRRRVIEEEVEEEDGYPLPDLPKGHFKLCTGTDSLAISSSSLDPLGGIGNQINLRDSQGSNKSKREDDMPWLWMKWKKGRGVGEGFPFHQTSLTHSLTKHRVLFVDSCYWDDEKVFQLRHGTFIFSPSLSLSWVLLLLQCPDLFLFFCCFIRWKINRSTVGWTIDLHWATVNNASLNGRVTTPSSKGEGDPGTQKTMN